jgi:hypothetical protein
MTPLFNKLNLGTNRDILILHAPDSFESELSKLSDVTIQRDLSALPKVSFAIAFVKSLKEIEAVTKLLPKTDGDVIIWFAYPKGTSKRYKCEFNRDNGWDSVGKAGFEGVRMVAIDEDWSALRFRRATFIKTMTRDPSGAKSAEGKAKTQKKK